MRLASSVAFIIFCTDLSEMIEILVDDDGVVAVDGVTRYVTPAT